MISLQDNIRQLTSFLTAVLLKLVFQSYGASAKLAKRGTATVVYSDDDDDDDKTLMDISCDVVMATTATTSAT